MSLFNSEQFGKDPRFWMGQIVDDSEWKENRPGGLYDTPDDVPGWGYRYKVRIFGKHPEAELRDVELPWADVLYPVTSGSGHGSSFQTPNLRKGNFVFGLYLDGMDETQPLILGCFGNNDQTNLQFSRPPVGFAPFSGLYSEQVPVYSIPPGKPGGPIEATGLGDNENNEANGQELQDGLLESTLPTTEKCAKSLDKTQIELTRFIQRIEETQRRSQNWSYWVNTKGSELASGVFRTETIDIDIQRSAQFISGELKEFLNGIREFISNLIDAEISKFYKLFFPQEEKILETAHDGAIDLITCLFNKIIANLIKIIGDLLKSIVGKIVNAATCAVESIVSSILGQLLGLITGTLNSILGPISSIVGGVIDLAGDILGFVSQILGFFLCDEQSACPENTEWSSWGGASSSKTTLDFNKIFNKTKEISEKSKKVVDPNNFDFNLDFSSVFEDTCNVGPIFCGPPTVDFSGGGGRGARGNAIVSATGSILGVDIITPGGGYTRPPSVNFVDACGVGKGAKARARLNKNGGLKEVIIDKPGSGYKTNFDGSRGGDGRVYATPDQVVIKREDGRYDLPYNPGDFFEVFDGDEVTGPFDSITPSLPGGISGGSGEIDSSIPFDSITPSLPDGISGGSGEIDSSIPLIAGGTGGDEISVGGNTAIAGELIVTAGGTGGISIVAGGAGGSPVTIGGVAVIAGGIGGTPIIVNGNEVTSGGLPVTVGSIGGLSVTAGGTGGTPVIIQNPSISSGGTGGTPLILNGSPVTAGGTGGTPLTVDGNLVDAAGRPIVIGGTGGTPVVIGGIGGASLTVNGKPITINDLDSTSLGNYSVMLKLGDVEIQSTGVNYSPNDTIVVEPSNGAILEPVFGPFGSIIDVNIIDEGEGFVERPNIVIKTETGYNAILIPILSVNRIRDIPDELYRIPEGTRVIQVIDCIGKV
jgi:hypothetical protein